MQTGTHHDRAAQPRAARADFAGFWWGFYFRSEAEEVCAAG